MTPTENRHIFVSKSDCRLARTEQKEQFVEEQQTADHRCHTEYNIEQHDVAQDSESGGFVTLPQTYRGQRRATHTDHRTERRRDAHNGHTDTECRHRQRTDTLSDKDTVGDVIQSRSYGRNDRRYGIAREQFAQIVGT